MCFLLHEEALKITSLDEGGEHYDENLEQRPVENAFVGTFGSVAEGGLTSLIIWSV